MVTTALLICQSRNHGVSEVLKCKLGRMQRGQPGPTWRWISKSMAFCMPEKEFMFLTSTLVPNASRPTGRTDTFTSHRMDPSCRHLASLRHFAAQQQETNNNLAGLLWQL